MAKHAAHKQKPPQTPPRAPALSAEFLQAVAAFKKEDFTTARHLAETAVLAQPKHGDAWNLLAVATQKLGDTEGALRIFEKAASQSQSAELFKNYGIMLRRAGRFEEAKTQLTRALTLHPAYEEAAAHLGDVCLTLMQPQEAEAAYRKAVALAPKNPRYLLLATRAALLCGTDRNAQQATLKHIITQSREQNDDRTLNDALITLGSLLYHDGRRLEALPLLTEAVQKGGVRLAESEFASCISLIRFKQARPDLKPLLVKAFKEVWIRPADILRVSANLLLHEPAFKETLALTESAPSSTLLGHACVTSVMTDELLRTAITATMVTDCTLERMLTMLRHALLLASSEGAVCEVSDTFLIALAHQGFANEYAFHETTAETAMVEALMTDIGEALKEHADIMIEDLALLAAYRPLHRLPYADAILKRRWPEAFDSVLTRQLREPLEERALRGTIPSITPITDTVSTAVRSQYEENPYPRWLEAPGKAENYMLPHWLNVYFPHAPKPDGTYADPLEVLVAGCGTGQQSVSSALRFARANVLAVDLSLASLAYAVRKTKELGITNVSYAQGDILGLGTLDRQFDIVECGGVLHHLANPMDGWRVLTDLTRPGGYMFIGLYSELARRYLEPVRTWAKERGFGTTTEALRRFRNEVLTLPNDHPAAMVAERRDFYSISMLRDLVFHVQEHRFTIPKIMSAVKELGLEFGGFNLPPETLHVFRRQSGKDADLLSLEQWASFEETNPQAFLGMYQFLVKKPA